MPEEEFKPVARSDDESNVDAALADTPTPASRKLFPRRLKLAGAGAGACALAAALGFGLLGSGSGNRGAATAAGQARVAVATPEAAAEDPPAGAPLKSHPKVVVAVGPGEAPPLASTNTPNAAPASQPDSDAEVRQQLAQFKQHLTGVDVARGPVPAIRPDGTAVAPLEAPAVVAKVMAAGNAIATTPYKWGGGHGGWKDTGYDCSGSVSFALAGAGLMKSPLTSGGFMTWGDPGPGRWITIYANNGHMFMIVAGLRFDTSGANGGTRWQSAKSSYSGYAVRHPPGL